MKPTKTLNTILAGITAIGLSGPAQAKKPVPEELVIGYIGAQEANTDTVVAEDGANMLVSKAVTNAYAEDLRTGAEQSVNIDKVKIDKKNYGSIALDTLTNNLLTLEGKGQEYSTEILEGRTDLKEPFIFDDLYNCVDDGFTEAALAFEHRTNTNKMISEIYVNDQLAVEGDSGFVILDCYTPLSITGVREIPGEYFSQETIDRYFGKPRIIGLDLNGDGTLDAADADGDGVLDSVIGIDCSAPFPYRHTLIVEPTDNYSADGQSMPENMSLSQGELEIYFDPVCEQAGNVYTPVFTVTNGIVESDGLLIQYRVN